MAKHDDAWLTFFIDPGADGFDDVFADLKHAGREAIHSLRQTANDAAGIMAQVVTKDTWELAWHMGIQKSDLSRYDSGFERYEVGSNAKNRSNREYAIFEHLRHEGVSFFDAGEQFANDAVWEGAIAKIDEVF